jgi:hypothetical protein
MLAMLGRRFGLMRDHLGREDIGPIQLLEPFGGGLAREDPVEHLLTLGTVEIAVKRRRT